MIENIIDDAIRTVGVMFLYPDGYTFEQWVRMAEYLDWLEKTYRHARI